MCHTNDEMEFLCQVTVVCLLVFTICYLLTQKLKRNRSLSQKRPTETKYRVYFDDTKYLQTVQEWLLNAPVSGKTPFRSLHNKKLYITALSEDALMEALNDQKWVESIAKVIDQYVLRLKEGTIDGFKEHCTRENIPFYQDMPHCSDKNQIEVLLNPCNIEKCFGHSAIEEGNYIDSI